MNKLKNKREAFIGLVALFTGIILLNQFGVIDRILALDPPYRIIIGVVGFVVIVVLYVYRKKL